MTDPTMLALILRNFLSNAIRYTSQGGVLIGIRRLPAQNQSILLDYCQVCVWDTGSGMTPMEIKHIFDSFYQIERNNSGNQGLGLGLAIVKGMAQLLQAKVVVKSALGRGSQFSLMLPICSVDNELIISQDAAVSQLQNTTVLIVDDDDAVLKSMQLLLEIWGYQVIAVMTLSEAVIAFRTYQPDIVVTDFRLAGTETGEDVILAIQETSMDLLSAQFIILTADTSPQLFTATKEVNPIVLHKPIDPKTLRQCLQNIAVK